jgi:hypothetical protein
MHIISSTVAVMFKVMMFFLIWFGCIEQNQPDSDRADNETELAFHGAMGWAATTLGGRGGKIIKVTNLNADGEGSFKAAVETEGSRIIVFEVAGVIDLSGESIQIEQPFITVMGQTAPAPGITFIKGGLSIRTHQVIIQHLRVRPGENNNPKKSGWEMDAISTSSAHHVIIDHCSISWATDENLSASGPRFEGDNIEEWRKNTSHTITFSNNLIAEALSNSTHSKGEHSKGSLIHDNVTKVAIIGNIYSSNYDRNPLFKGGSQGVVVNNFIFNPGSAVIDYGLVKGQWGNREFSSGKISIVGNVLEKGLDSKEELQFWHSMGPVEVYFHDNKIDGDNYIVDRNQESGCVVLEKQVSWPEKIDVKPTDELKEYLLKNVGAIPWNRDSVDIRIISEIANGTNRIINSEKEVGGYPFYKPTFRKFNIEEWDLNSMKRKSVFQ